MFKNYLKIALRNLWKHKVDSLISIGGLASGMACCILLVLYVQFEWSYDNFHEDPDRLYRVVQKSVHPGSGEVTNSVSTPYPLATALADAFPEMDHSLRLAMMPFQVRQEGKFTPQDILLADKAFFEVFSFPLVSGNAASALSAPDQIVITQNEAKRIFGSKNPLGEVIEIRVGAEERFFTISGIAKDPPANSSISFRYVLPIEIFLQIQSGAGRTFVEQSWYEGFAQTWLKLKPGVNSSDLHNGLQELLKTHYDEQFLDSQKLELWLQPLEEVYYNAEVFPHFTRQGNVTYSWILAGIALVILAISSFNFMSLTLSRTAARSGEIGLRKVAGAQRRQLVQQFYGEVLVTCSIAFLFALALAEILLPVFQTMTQKDLPAFIDVDPFIWLTFFGLLLVTTFFTGFYPSLVLTGKKASELFKSSRSAEKTPLFVKILITAQFILSISFLITAFIMQHQLNYLVNKDMGFSPEGLIVIQVDHIESEQKESLVKVLIQELRNQPEFENVSGNGMYFFDGYGWGALRMHITGIEELNQQINIEAADEQFIEAMGIQITEGKNFSEEKTSELRNGIIVNRRFIEAMDIKDPVGHEIREDWQSGFFYEPKVIIGVIEDYHFRTLHYSLEPMVIQHIDAPSGYEISSVLVKTKEGSVSDALTIIDSVWNNVFPDEYLNYTFMDDRLQLQYAEEERWSRIIQASSIVAILLTCFGLFGLSTLSVQRRKKEIGIRKVMGASISAIILLLNRDFLKLVLAGFVFAIPIAWYAMNRWLEEFAYRIDVGAGVFLLAGAAAILIALATVSWQSVRAALLNPVDSLRSE